MKDESKWRLPGGKFLEDILYEHFKKESQEHSAHSWVIDLDDSAVKSCFNNLEWSHISEQMPQWPDSDSFMGQSLMRFEEVCSIYNVLPPFLFGSRFWYCGG